MMAATNLTVVRTRTLPFTMTNSAENQDNKAIMANMKKAIKSIRQTSISNGNDNMTMDDINTEIVAYRQERHSSNA